MSDWVEVRAPARLHLGFVDLHGGLGRRFGSLGLAITGQDAVVRACRGAPGELDVQGMHAARARAAAERMHAWLAPTAGTRVRVAHAARTHAGLGSGTQLALTVAHAVAMAHGRTLGARELAPIVGRGARSGIGIAAFDAGGFIVDGGHGAVTRVPPVLARLEFPLTWPIVLVFDDAHAGLHGAAERQAFHAAPPMSPTLAAELSRWCLVGILPAVAEQDFAAFTRAVDAIQARIGDYFAPFQGGAAFTSPAVAAALADVRRTFALDGIGQSSWGPTGFVFTPGSEVASAVVDRIAHVGGAHTRLTCEIVQAANVGARWSAPPARSD
ncbi:MAG: beta-ribofuranosylaminobenzene 5'-phosphate synthase family protein [Gammaproteobacteria bacterium]